LLSAALVSVPHLGGTKDFVPGETAEGTSKGAKGLTQQGRRKGRARSTSRWAKAPWEGFNGNAIPLFQVGSSGKEGLFLGERKPAEGPERGEMRPASPSRGKDRPVCSPRGPAVFPCQKKKAAEEGGEIN